MKRKVDLGGILNPKRKDKGNTAKHLAGVLTLPATLPPSSVSILH